jgi:hypothetical protein
LRFKERALFFRDELGGDVIGVVWIPHIFEPANLRLTNVIDCKPVSKDVSC